MILIRSNQENCTFNPELSSYAFQYLHHKLLEFIAALLIFHALQQKNVTVLSEE